MRSKYSKVFEAQRPADSSSCPYCVYTGGQGCNWKDIRGPYLLLPTAPSLLATHVNERNSHALSSLCFYIPLNVVIPLHIVREYFGALSLL